MKTLLRPILYLLSAAVVSVGLLFGAEAVTDIAVEKQKNKTARESFGGLLDADQYEALNIGAYGEINAAYRAKDADGSLLGYAVTASVKGYGGEMKVHVALDSAGDRFLGIRIGENHETENLGARVAEAAFTDQFRSLPAPAYLDGYTGLERAAEPSQSVEAVTGATISSKAVVRAVNVAYAFIRDTQGVGT